MSAYFRSAPKLRRTTFEGLAATLATDHPRPRQLSVREYGALSNTEKLDYNTGRARYASGGIHLRTEAGDEAHRLFRSFLRTNVDAENTSGLMLDAQSHMGKTSLATHLMRWTMKNYLAEFPDAETLGHVPIVYIEAEPRSSGSALMKAFIRFFGGTIHPRDTTDDLVIRTIELMTRAQTHVVVLDEFQNIRAKNAGNGETIDYLKRLHNEVGATFIISGIDVLASPVLTDTPAGRQFRSRFTDQPLTPYSTANQAETERWQQLLVGFEQELPLLAQERNDILQFTTLLMKRTQGSVGALAKLLIRTTVDLIWADDPSHERLTAELLMNQRLDIASERGVAAALESKKKAARAAKLDRTVVGHAA